MRKAFLSNVRFDRPVSEEAEAGLSLASLGLSFADRMAMRMMRHVPGRVLRAAGAPGLFAAHARKLVESSSGLCAIAAPDATDRSLFRSGRAMQCAWLALTESGFAVQPMMSLMVLSNALERGTPHLIASLGRARIEALLAQFRAQLPEIAGKPLFLMRFGRTQTPHVRTGRLEPRVRDMGARR